MAPFDDRSHAGRLLGFRLVDLIDEDVVILALPRGGLPVGVEIARLLHADLDVLVVKKLGAPTNPELALGAVGADGKLLLNTEIVSAVRADTDELKARAEALAEPLAERAVELRGGRPPRPIGDRVAVVVDDGVATGASLLAALKIARSAEPDRLLAAVPVAPPDVCQDLATVADRVECLQQPEALDGVGRWYEDFHQLTDDEVHTMLHSIPVRETAS